MRILGAAITLHLSSGPAAAERAKSTAGCSPCRRLGGAALAERFGSAARSVLAGRIARRSGPSRRTIAAAARPPLAAADPAYAPRSAAPPAVPSLGQRQRRARPPSGGGTVARKPGA